MFIFVLITATGFAQQRNPGERPEGPDGPPLDSLDQGLLLPPQMEEKLELTSFYLTDIYDQQPFQDSVLDYKSLHYNPVFEQQTPHLFLGNNGSAAIPYTQLIKRNTGFDLGVHAYDIYAMSLDSFRWHKTNIPFSDLYFSPGPTEYEFRVKAKFGTNFKNRINFNVDFERIIENGYYKNQATKQSSLAVGFWQRSKDERRQTFLNYIVNIHQEENNGGIADTSLLDEPNYSIRANLPVRLSGATGRLENKEFVLLNYYRLSYKPDSLVTPSDPALHLVSKLSYGNGFFKYYDEDTDATTDSSYYGPLLIDDIGIRNYISYDKIGLKQGIQTKLKYDTRLNAGLTYKWWIIDQETTKLSHKHDASVYADLRTRPFKGLELYSDTKYHFGSFTGDFSVKLGAEFQVRGFLVLEGYQSIQSSHPSLLEEAFYLNTQLIQSNDFNKVRHITSSIHLRIPKFGTQIGFNLDNVTNHIYFDSNLLFKQLDGTISFTTFDVKQHLKFRGINLVVGGNIFLHNADVLEIPRFQLDSRLFYRGPALNNRFIMNGGIEFKWMDGFAVPGYQAAVGQFYPQYNFYTDSYPMLNVFLGFKIKGFRLFVRSENILNAITGKVHYNTLYNPLNDFRTFRLGVSWLLTN